MMDARIKSAHDDGYAHAGDGGYKRLDKIPIGIYALICLVPMRGAYRDRHGSRGGMAVDAAAFDAAHASAVRSLADRTSGAREG